MTMIPRLALLAPLLLAACSDDDSLPAPEVTYSVSYKDGTTTQPRILSQEVRLDEGPVVKQKLAFGTGELDAGPVDGGYEIRILDASGAARLRVSCKKSKASSGNQSIGATFPDNSRYTLDIIEEGAECDQVK